MCEMKEEEKRKKIQVQQFLKASMIKHTQSTANLNGIELTRYYGLNKHPPMITVPRSNMNNIHQIF